MSLLINILGFVLVIGVLVAVHEFGHFWVARRVGVRVLRFSIGFGRPLLQRTGADGTEYVLAAIPLGGYVKMLDEREAPVDEAEQHRAFNRKPLWARNAVICAGPAFNFALAIVAYWLVFVIGATEVRPVIGPVAPESPAATAGLASGDEFLRVDGNRVQAWDETVMTLIGAADDGPFPIEVERAGGARASLDLDLTGVQLLEEQGEVLERIGLQPMQPRIDPVINEVVEGSSAARAGLQPGDRIRALDGEPMDTWRALVMAIRDRPEQTVSLAFERQGDTLTRTFTLDSRGSGGDRTGVLGVTPQVPEGTFSNLRHEVRYGPVAAVGEAVGSSWRAATLTVDVLVKMVIGEASVKNLSGPINIAQYAGDSVSLGLIPFLKFLAIVSISLGILNLMPVPVLDGGHLLYNTIEWVRGRPLSEAAQGMGQQIGMVLLFMLMALAFYNDLNRIFGAGG
ncbi:RIP metalloprotease RseP [Spiribacter aquaticus]|uniref:Zinc metalloprotease n=1 Tax=Spiribacter aquaticus TaxID=1935996 RepID=A0A557RF49_9GAMM|nr:RIP metalloprotease RseP [Spiribacter aquaticus]KAF0280360.1 RIP metalloprotease RseP [Spiribacter roseus]TVO63784.1 RIP metalloprotease RseP [Spiribacter aquaticus]